MMLILNNYNVYDSLFHAVGCLLTPNLHTLQIVPMEEEAPNFSLKSGTDSFVSRSQDVFASLGALEDKHSAFLKATALAREKDDADLLKHDSDEDDEFVNQSKNRTSDSTRLQLSQTRDTDYEPRSHSRSPRRDVRSGSADEDENQQAQVRFKRPARPSQRCSRPPIPDFRKHPEKYTQYSLGDVSENDMSERANQRAAFDFLVERKLEREKQERKLAGLPDEDLTFDSSDAACSQGKITFSRPKQQKLAALEKCVNKDEVLALCPTTDADDDIDEDTKDYDVTGIADDDAPDRNVTESKISSSSFKSRKNVKRHIRTKNNDADSD